MQEKSLEQLTAEIKAKYGIGGNGAGPERFPIVVIRPSSYDTDGYVVQWFRSAAAREELARIGELIGACLERKVLGASVATELRMIDETEARVRPERLARELQGGRGLVVVAGVQANQFARAMDLALPLRVTGVLVCMEGFFITSNVRMQGAAMQGAAVQGAATGALREAMHLGISLFTGRPTQERMDEVIGDAWRGRLKAIYTDGGEPAAGEPPPMAATRAMRGSTEAAWLSPFECAFSTVVPLGDSPEGSRADAAEKAIRRSLNQGVGRFLLAEGSIAQNAEWAAIFDRLRWMREQEKLHFECTLQVDAVCHRLPGFIEQAKEAGVRAVFLDLASRMGGEEAIAAWRSMLLEWKRAGMVVFARTPVGGGGEVDGQAGETAVLDEVRMLQRELPIDVLEPHCGGSASWEKVCREAWKEFYTLEHMEKVLRRAMATGTDVADLMAVLLWFHFLAVQEKVDPLLGGSWRRKRRRDRRPSMEKEDPVSFYSSLVVEWVYQQIRMARLQRRFRRFVKQLEGEPGAKSYTDGALGGILMPHLPAAR